jgi:N-methylhydantoinase A/oxoprolinase/acetone carboxylase beta subunit
MEHAIRLISVERGHDPRDFSLVCFGGAGGLHAAELARALGIPRVVVPQHPGALSALGLLQSDVRKDYSRSMLIDAVGADEGIRAALDSLHRLGLNDMREEGFEEESVQSLDSVDLRYRGQSYELTVSFTPDFVSSFHQLHEPSLWALRQESRCRIGECPVDDGGTYFKNRAAADEEDAYSSPLHRSHQYVVQRSTAEDSRLRQDDAVVRP